MFVRCRFVDWLSALPSVCAIIRSSKKQYACNEFWFSSLRITFLLHLISASTRTSNLLDVHMSSLWYSCFIIKLYISAVLSLQIQICSMLIWLILWHSFIVKLCISVVLLLLLQICLMFTLILCVTVVTTQYLCWYYLHLFSLLNLHVVNNELQSFFYWNF